jgi:phosphoribosylanthranilate isomerase
MTWVKICGMTNLEDALVAVEAGADAVGFVFYEKSPRCVTVEVAREIVGKLPERVEKVGVFVGSTREVVSVACNRAGLTLAQTYVDARIPASRLDDEFLENLPCPAIVAFRASQFLRGQSDDPDVITGFHVQNKFRDRIAAMLLDSGTADSPGGTGQRFDWRNAVLVKDSLDCIGLNLIVAGGLTYQNVTEAIEILRPWGVDVASGVEARPGKKDAEKVRAFVKAVREMDRKSV